ncbi:MAG: DUF1127 domain-containing protein [Tabrizicola sp.]|nr:DUF1127 domain-containing protein [Tabrizicola sp.]
MSIFSLSADRISLSRASGTLRRLRAALALHRTRRSLALLDDHLLADIGISRDEAEHEATRRVWDAPVHWRG